MIAAVLRRHHRDHIPPPAPPPRSVYEGGDSPWPVDPDLRVRIIGRDGRVCESSPVRLVRSGELVEFDVAGRTVRGQLV
jgi:hypothetical protein